MTGARAERALRVVLVAGLLTTCALLERGAPPSGPETIRLFDDLGSFGRQVSTRSERAQAFFDQGWTLVYGFNHEAAIRSFKAAQAHDPGCAMCFYGEALALGPNINAPMGPDQHVAARAAVERALEAVSDPREAAFVRALATRYDPAREDERAALDRAYAQAMSSLVARYPDDDDAQTLFAASLMNLAPWKYYDLAGNPSANTPEIVAALERVLSRSPDHPGANHYYIHAVEPSNSPERAIPAAERLETLVPGAGHLVHMPTHIYWRVGRYDDALRLNQRAVGVDETTFGWCGSAGFYAAGYYTHNIHFVWAAASEQGSSAVALGAARKLVAEVEPRLDLLPFLEAFLPIPQLTQLRFGRWDAVLAEPAPPASRRYATGLWHYARGLALLRKGDARASAGEAGTLAAIAQEDALAETLIGFDRAVDLLRIAALHLAGERQAAAGDGARALASLEEAVALQDELAYTEPPPFYFPVRQALGAVLLEAGRGDDAEAVYRADLARHPATPWSLLGLAQSLEAQGRAQDAAIARRGFETAWRRADLTLPGSRF